jgi:hypothetical protein
MELLPRNVLYFSIKLPCLSCIAGKLLHEGLITFVIGNVDSAGMIQFNQCGREHNGETPIIAPICLERLSASKKDQFMRH